MNAISNYNTGMILCGNRQNHTVRCTTNTENQRVQCANSLDNSSVKSNAYCLNGTVTFAPQAALREKLSHGCLKMLG